ncbi:major facilitator superfamily domain-containing protein [Ditylenchus destructor]|uniref:Major facilitator superfamily domain-containing protein n=1 Tax=Ditylenchus destructor TaxID=166010 RepID=A0AAD4R2D2_9BILA|nr:major facilitator superfamily domain-containing protein [Ditylenchus destructor]
MEEPPSRIRYFLLPLVLLCLTINWANILIFNFTVICMEPRSEPSNAALVHPDSPNTWSANIINPDLFIALVPQVSPISADSFPEREWSSAEKDQAMGLAAVGALLANFPIVTIINYYGPRYVFTAVGLLGAFSTALIPTMLRWGFYWFLAARVLQGIAFAGDMATFGHFITYWTSREQYAFFTATLCVYVQLAPIFSDPISGIICESHFGWAGVYYLHSLITVVLFATFFICYRNHPAQHPFVNELERLQIASGKDEADLKMVQRNVPYRDILSSTAVWAVFIGAIGNYAGINLILQFTPIYLNEAQKFNVQDTGFLSALPPLLEALMKEFAGYFNDKISPRILSEKKKTKIFNSIAFMSVALFLVVVTLVPEGHGMLSLAIFTVGAMLLGFNVGGFYKSGSLIAGPYAPFVMGQISTALTIMLLVVPLIVNTLTPDGTPQQWATAFYVIAGIMVACNIFYVVFARGTPCYWATRDIHKQKIFRSSLSVNPSSSAISSSASSNA